MSAYYAMVVVVYDSNEVARDPNGDVFDTDDCLNQRRVA